MTNICGSYYYYHYHVAVVVHLPSHVRLFVTLWIAACQASLSLTIPQRLSKFMFIASVIPSSRLILWCPLLLCPQSFPASGTFFSELSVHIRWTKYWSFSFSIGPSSEYSGLSSLKIYWFDLLPGQGTFKSLLQHHSLKASILWRSACFTVQLSQLYTTAGKTIALTIWTFVGRVMSLLFNSLSMFVIAFLPRSNHLLISRLWSLSAVILEPKKRKSVTISFSGCSLMERILFCIYFYNMLFFFFFYLAACVYPLWCKYSFIIFFPNGSNLFHYKDHSLFNYIACLFN